MTIEAKGFKEGVLTNGSGYDYPDGRWRLKCPKGFSEPRGGVSPHQCATSQYCYTTAHSHMTRNIILIMARLSPGI
ncbi:hypothetical protein Plhal710r2_c005g0023641 [Plasmopara halstedii]